MIVPRLPPAPVPRPLPPSLLRPRCRGSRRLRPSPSSGSLPVRKPLNNRSAPVRRPRRPRARRLGPGLPPPVLPLRVRALPLRRRGLVLPVRHPSPARGRRPQPLVSGPAPRRPMCDGPAPRVLATTRSRHPRAWGRPDDRRAAHPPAQVRVPPAAVRRARGAVLAPTSGCHVRAVPVACRVPTRR